MSKKNPYFIDEPAAISFSGGRTSAYMLYKILEAHGGKLPGYIKVTFANTGKEMPQTLDFVRDCGKEWGVDIVWLELSEMTNIANEGERNKFKREYRTVDHKTAARNGEPFNVFLKAVPAIPNPVMRMCTSSLKIRIIGLYLKACGYESPWTQAIGIRRDEERRARKILARPVDDGQERILPLFWDGVTKEIVGEFWRNQEFDLQLPNNNGVTDWGNCDLCFLKAKGKRASIMRDRPELSKWWADAEKFKKQQFRRDEPNYERMQIIASDQGNLFNFDDGEESIACFCGD